MTDAITHDPLAAILAFEAPYLEARLVRLGIAATASDAALLVRELKRYFGLGKLHAARSVPMISTRVDEAWHQFLLFSHEYAEFCASCVGRFIHHQPEPSGAEGTSEGLPVMTVPEFHAAYAAAFGPLPEAWRDELALAPHTRLRWFDDERPRRVAEQGQQVELLLEGDPALVLCRTNLRAAPALQFIAGHVAFIVRELPGLRAEREQLDLCRPLVKARLLEVAP